MQRLPVLLLLSAAGALAQMHVCFDFRSSSGYVTDPQCGGPGNAGFVGNQAYPQTQTINGTSMTFGWSSGASYLTGGNDQTSWPQVAGHQYVTSGHTATFKVTLPHPGMKLQICLAAGNSTYYSQYENITFYDSSTSLFSLIGNTTSVKLLDAAGNARTPAQWTAGTPYACPSSTNTAVTEKFATNTLNMVLNAIQSTVASLELVEVLPDYQCSGPSSGSVYNASTTFTCTKTTGTFSGSQTVTISDGGQGGAFSPSASITPSNGSSSFTFTYTPAVTGAITLSYSDNWSGLDYYPMAYTSNAVVLTLSGCSNNGFRVPSGACTVTTTGATFDGAHSVTVSDGGNLGTITPSLGSAGQSSVTVTPANGASSFTFTYNPYLVGAKVITVTSNTSLWTDPSPLAYTVMRSDACSFNAAADGNWAAAGTWTVSGCGHTTPDTGDTVTIAAHHVTVASGTAAYMGSCPANNTTYDLTIAPSGATSGWLEVAGTLWLCSNAKLNAPNASNPASFGKFQIDTGAKFVLDNNNNATVAYRVIPGATGGWNNLIVGTFGDTCTFGASYSCPTNIVAINNSAVNPILLDTNSTTDNVTYQIYGTAIKECGSASKGCLEYATAGVSNSYANAGIIDIEGSMFDTTGTIQNPVEFSSITSVNLTNDRFLNDLAGVFSLSSSGSPSINGNSKTCWFQGNVFSGVMGTNASNRGEQWHGCTFLGNTFGLGFYFAGSDSSPMATFDWNLSMYTFPDIALAVPVARNDYWMGNTSSSWHTLGDPGTMSETLDGHVYHNLNAANDEGYMWGAVPGSGPTRTMRNTISLRGPSGRTSGVSLIYNVSGGTGATVIQEHNGWFGSAHIAWGGTLGHPPGNYATNQIYAYYRSNNHWAIADSMTPVSNFPFATYTVVEGGSPSTAPNNNVNVAGIANNNVYGGSTAGTFTAGVNTNCNPSPSVGTHYDICATSTPGATDLAVDPKSVDNTRNELAWASRVKGQAASAAGLLTAMMNCQDAWFCTENLWSWVRQGMQPTNLALKGAAHDGKIVGLTGTFGSGYSGSCGVTFTPQDSGDLGTGAAATCSFVGGVPKVTISSGGNYYRVATSAAATITGTCTGGCVPAALNAVVAPSDIGPVQIVAFGKVE